MLIKTCLRCGETKAVTEFHKDMSKADCLRPYCKSCAINYKPLNKTRRAPEHKKCLMCKRLLPKGMFSYKRTSADTLDDKCATCKRWKFKAIKPRIEEILEHEKILHDIYVVAVNRLVERYPDDPNVLPNHRGEFEQICWQMMRRDKLFRKWKPPLWLHESSKVI